MKRMQIEALNTNKINKFRHLKRDLIVVEPPLSIDIKVYLFLKHNIHKRFLFADIAIAHNTLYKMLCDFYIVKINIKVSFIIFKTSK